MNNKPKMYHNNTPKRFNNNMLVYNSMDTDNYSKKSEDKMISSNDIRKKIDDIVNSNSFIYSKMVNIVIGDDIIQRKIIGVYNNNLITIDNEYILIDNIKDIYI